MNTTLEIVGTIDRPIHIHPGIQGIRNKRRRNREIKGLKRMGITSFVGIQYKKTETP